MDGDMEWGPFPALDPLDEMPDTTNKKKRDTSEKVVIKDQFPLIQETNLEERVQKYKAECLRRKKEMKATLKRLADDNTTGHEMLGKTTLVF